MTETKIEVGMTAATLSKEIIPELIHARGPCMTLLLPPYRPGEPGETTATLLKAELQQAAKDLSMRGIAEPMIATLLEPLHECAREDSFLTGSETDRVIFRSPRIFRQFALPLAASPARPCTIGNHFWIRPILSSLALPAHIYVLEVTKRAVHLLACGFTDATPRKLPHGTPETLDEALGFKPPDHELVNRSAAGPSNGAMRGVQFGTSSGRETQHAHLHDFYRAVDRGVNELLGLNQAPLILAGVNEDVAIYRALNTYSNLLDQGIHGSPGATMTPAHIMRQAHGITVLDFQRQAALQMSESKEHLAPARFSTDLEHILRAAADGRVSDLYLDEHVQRIGKSDSKVFSGHDGVHDEDLLNIAAVDTLLHGGAVCCLPSHSMTFGVAAAALRY